MAVELAKTYRPGEVEAGVLARWNAARAFHAEAGAGGEAYCIVIPPPNVTAALHMGHALNNTLQDILIRWRRMAGDNAVWIPGTDHAGIATQTVVDKRLQAEGRAALKDYKKMEAAGKGGREQFVAKVQAWKDEYEATITNQLKTMGCSCDWERQRFTMDGVCEAAVREAFFRLFKDGLIYRGKRLVNWDPATQTALADDEVEVREVDGHFYYLRYPLEDGTGFVTVATTRPETMLGDTAVAVNPKDPRAAGLRGKRVRLPIVNRVVPVIEDDYVVLAVAHGGDPNDVKAQFASGFLKVTPAHDPNDWEIGVRHGLGVINVFGPDGSISDKHGWQAEDFEKGEAGFLVGKDRFEARKMIVRWFKEKGLLEEQRPYRHSVGHSYRSHVPVEPYLSDQWYVDVDKDFGTEKGCSDPRGGLVEGTKIPRNSLAGLALRAMAKEEQTAPSRSRLVGQSGPLPYAPGSRGSSEQTAPSRSRLVGHGAVFKTYLITFTCYGTWLHGDERGSVDRDHAVPGSLLLEEDEIREKDEFYLLKHPSVVLETAQRREVARSIEEVCRHRGWEILAGQVRSNHVHVVVLADTSPERVMIDFKSYATRRLTEVGLMPAGDRVWTRHGSTRYLNDESSVESACRYVREQQGGALEGSEIRPLPYGRGSSDPEQTAPSRSRLVGQSGPLPYAPGSRGSSEQTTPLRSRLVGADHSLTVAEVAGRQSGEGGALEWEGGLRIIPERYGKTFQAWHENIRDWCISRQLWWGHRIPVWKSTNDLLTNFRHEIKNRENSDTRRPELLILNWRERKIRLGNPMPDPNRPEEILLLHTIRPLADGTFEHYYCPEPGCSEFEEFLNNKAHQDSDVLDTWFSSALWPMSTLGWPDPSKFPEVFSDGGAALNKWNPSHTLSTAREIITLWVSRMVMFNLYFRNCLPFSDVFIHAMIQDGQGRKMSKSLGNGVDPLDIIHSHGSDAMRFTLAKMTTDTQDVRLPVVKDEATGKNTSEKFDEGRNFSNKLWNAVRFALGNLEEAEAEDAGRRPGLTESGSGLADRWILSRLARVAGETEKALKEYEFSRYAQGLYDFIWRDLCDWYIEAVKPTVRGNMRQREVLAACIDVTLRLLHPVMPFISEKLWEALNDVVPVRGVEGVLIPGSGLLIKASWPVVSEAIVDEQAEAEFGMVQQVVGAIREVRTTYKVPPRQKVACSARAAAGAAERVMANRGMIESMAGVEVGAVGPGVEKPVDAAATVAGEAEIYLHGLVDAGAEKTRLTKRLEEVSKNVATLRGRLGNKSYTDRAPASLVQQSREQLAAAEREAQTVQEQLDRLR